MDNNLDDLEEKIRQKESASRRSYKKMKISGRSVFKLQEIIKKQVRGLSKSKSYDQNKP